MKVSLEEIKEYGLESMTHPGHLKSHILRVEKTVRKYFLQKEGVDSTVLLTAVYLHDVARALEKRMRKEGKFCCHAETGAELADEYLHFIDFPKEKIPLVVHAIETHRYSKDKKPNTMEAKILHECDKLDAIGAIGIIRTLISYPAGDSTAFYHKTEPIARIRKLDDNKYGIDHFFIKLFKVKDKISFEELKPEAEKRHAYMEKFVNELEKEALAENYNGPVHKIFKILEESVNLQDYEEDNPLKEGNTLLGRLLNENNPFIHDFVEQLKSEIL
ncbi:hypothetical protein COX58_00595 [archaeon CG_4_10_14_0_2_um_filter_Archaea_38_6]|nr:MAG: hypothetical protein COS83_04210 [archaeon CG07_land_8_20_14_0_80_38_8]PIU88638.1 MAG: hypothetical protein COS64_03320 [archaeon CG06_land_8_20_14_3_00_37_11]PJA23013.1 MAG: hypothetical protein COX58_00595 [archaeon CG_4_10_14_0_2_um_filter_Archaea_38_6]